MKWAASSGWWRRTSETPDNPLWKELDAMPELVFALDVWPVYQAGHLNPLTDLTAEEYDIIRAFDEGMEKYYEENRKKDTQKGKLHSGAVVMGGLPDDLVSRGQVSSMSLGLAKEVAKDARGGRSATRSFRRIRKKG